MKILPNEEFLELFLRYRNHGNQAARAAIIEANQGLVRSIADRHASSLHAGRYDRGLVSFIEWEDLTQAGTEGLLEALERFDPRRGCEFSTFAYAWIDKRIRLLIHSWLFIRNSREFLTVQAVDDPREEKPRRNYRNHFGNEAGPDSEAEIAEQAGMVNQILQTIPDRDREIISLRFGIRDGREWSSYKIAARVALSPQRVRQIVDETLVKLWNVYQRQFKSGRMPI